MKIIYFFLRRHCYNFDSKIFQLSCFSSKGWEVERWSAVNWTFGKLEKPLNIEENEGCHYIDGEKKLYENLQRIKDENCYFLIYPYDDTVCSWQIRKAIKKYKFKFANIGETQETNLCNSVWPLNISARIILSQEAKRMLWTVALCTRGILKREKKVFRIFQKFLLNFFGMFLYKSDLNFVTTNLYYYAYPNLLEFISKRNIMIHALAYDELKACENHSSQQKGSYVVFVDQYLSGHNNFKKMGKKFPVIDTSDYYKKLIFLFEKIEKDYNCEVVIAAHPKAEYKGSEFGERSIIYGQTNFLIKDAVFVLIHTSASFALVAGLKKTFINIYDSLFFENLPSFRSNFIAIQKVLHCKQLDIGDRNQVLDYKTYLTEYNQYYEDYFERYVRSKGAVGDNKLFYETVEGIVRNRI